MVDIFGLSARKAWDEICAGMGLLPFHAGGEPELWIQSEEKLGLTEHVLENSPEFYVLGLTEHVLENSPEFYVFESTMRELCVSEVSIFRDVSRSPAA